MSTKFSPVAFFIRNNNDLDHITPVAYALARESWPIKIVVGSHPGYLHDFRIKFLKRYVNVEVFHLTDFMGLDPHQKKNAFAQCVRTSPNASPGFEIWEPYYSQSIPREMLTPTLRSYFCAPDGTPMPAFLPGRGDENFFRRMFDQLFGVGEGIVAFDWVASGFVQLVGAYARYRHCPVVSLPHGLRVFANTMCTPDCLVPPDSQEVYTGYGIFDAVIFANPFSAKAGAKAIDKSKIAVLGSARYCEEWIDVLRNILPPYDQKVQESCKIVFFLRDVGYSVNWEEVIWTTRLITQFSDVHLLIRHHTRACGMDMLQRRWPELFENKKNQTVVTGNIPSTALINWADVVVDAGTSMVAQCVQQKKPVINIEYLHANITNFGRCCPSATVHCRDELYKRLIEQKRCPSPVLDQEILSYVECFLNPEGKNVLQAYRDFFGAF